MALFKKSGASTVVSDSFGGLDCTQGPKDSFRTAGYTRNFSVTSDGRLKKRCGYKKLLSDIDADTYFAGRVNGTDYFVYQKDDTLYALNPYTGASVASADTGIYDDGEYFIFGGLLYIFGGDMFWSFNGAAFSEVTPYVPTVAITVPNAGGGVINDSLNLLSEYAAVTCSPDGISASFVLPSFAYEVTEVSENGTVLSSSAYSYTRANRTLTFTSAPAGGTPDSVKATFRLESAYIFDRDKIGKRFCVYGGESDTRVFFYGTGNRIYYSDVTDSGADVTYIAAENFITVGDGTYNVTSLVRHYDRLIVFTSADSWYISPSTVSYDGYTKPSYPIFPLNDKIGCKNGAAATADNTPLTLTDGGIYKYTSSSVRDERNAVCISGRVASLLTPAFISGAICIDNSASRQVWFAYNGLVCVYDYSIDEFYVYDGIEADALFILGGQVAFFSDGGLYIFDSDIYTDDSKAYAAVWESGFCRMTTGEKPKKLRRISVSLVPESGSDIRLTVVPNRGKSVSFGQSGEFAVTIPDFSNLDFSAFTFECEGKPKSRSLRCKIGPLEYLRLRFENAEPDGRVTVAGITLTLE